MMKPYERYLTDLLFPSDRDKKDSILYPKLVAEGHQRIIGIFLPFLYVGWALFFLLNTGLFFYSPYSICPKDQPGV